MSVSTEELEEHARIFDKNHRHWDKNFYLNVIFLRAQQNWANDILRSRGYLLLNEVYELLGFETSLEGIRLGWVGNEGHVNFGIPSTPGNKLKLVFNIDGVVYDLLREDDVEKV